MGMRLSIRTRTPAGKPVAPGRFPQAARCPFDDVSLSGATGIVAFDDERPPRRRERQDVVKGDRLKGGPQFVISAGLDAHDPEVEVDLGESASCDHHGTLVRRAERAGTTKLVERNGPRRRRDLHLERFGRERGIALDLPQVEAQVERDPDRC